MCFLCSVKMEMEKPGDQVKNEKDPQNTLSFCRAKLHVNSRLEKKI